MKIAIVPLFILASSAVATKDASFDREVYKELDNELDELQTLMKEYENLAEFNNAQCTTTADCDEKSFCNTFHDSGRCAVANCYWSPWSCLKTDHQNSYKVDNDGQYNQNYCEGLGGIWCAYTAEPKPGPSSCVFDSFRCDAGESCRYNKDCQSNACESGVCTGEIGNGCTENKDCFSGKCDRWDKGFHHKKCLPLTGYMVKKLDIFDVSLETSCSDRGNKKCDFSIEIKNVKWSDGDEKNVPFKFPMKEDTNNPEWDEHFSLLHDLNVEEVDYPSGDSSPDVIFEIVEWSTWNNSKRKTHKVPINLDKYGQFGGQFVVVDTNWHEAKKLKFYVDYKTSGHKADMLSKTDYSAIDAQATQAPKFAFVQ